MAAKLVSVEGTKIKIEVVVELKSSMLESEESIQQALNEAGCIGTEQALLRFDTDGSPLLFGGQKWYSKGRQPKAYQGPQGEVVVERHVYQKSGGGKTFCPLEQAARIIVTSTPRLAKMVSHKFGHGSSTAVSEDFQANHGRPVARSFIQNVAEAVGAVAQAKEEHWEYQMPELPEPVATVAVGLDGTCMLLCEDGWREAMTGTLSLYDRAGERMHTIYLGAPPEYGKKRFYGRLERELERVRARYPQARYIGLADGAASNWQFLDGKVQECILDFYHAAEHLGQAAPAVSPTNAGVRNQWLEERAHSLKHESGAAVRLLKEMEALSAKRLPKREKQQLAATITYFNNHSAKMDYARYLREHLPIGSGVTEAACKTLIKQRLCAAGMRWKEKGAGVVISLRALVLTQTRWDQFWNKIDRYGFPLAA